MSRHNRPPFFLLFFELFFNFLFIPSRPEGRSPGGPSARCSGTNIAKGAKFRNRGLRPSRCRKRVKTPQKGSPSFPSGGAETFFAVFFPVPRAPWPSMWVARRAAFWATRGEGKKYHKKMRRYKTRGGLWGGSSVPSRRPLSSPDSCLFFSDS